LFGLADAIIFQNCFRLASVNNHQPGKNVPVHREVFSHMPFRTVVHPAISALIAAFQCISPHGIAAAKRRNDKKYHEYVRNN
jgi:hypothetical protein